jgi:hypothetical protein
LWQAREPLLVDEVNTTESEDRFDDVAVQKVEDVAAMDGEEGEVGKRAPLIGEEHTIFEALRTVDFWVLFISFLCGVGTGLAVMNNMGQIGLALGYALRIAHEYLGVFRADHFGYRIGVLHQVSLPSYFNLGFHLIFS